MFGAPVDYLIGFAAPKERAYNYPEGAWRAMEKMGLAFDRTTETAALSPSPPPRRQALVTGACFDLR